jgi:hypothetical protein
MRLILYLGIAAFLISSCSGGTGPIYSVPPLQQGQAQLVIYHPSGEFVGSVPLGDGPDVKVNSKIVCGLLNSRFFVTSVEPGTVTVSSTKALAIGTSVLSINAQKNKRYFIRITWNNGIVAATAGAGLIGEAAATGASSNGGPFVIELVDEQTATSEVSPLHMANCK